MRINWNELQAAKIADPYIKVLFPIMEAEDVVQLRDCMERYTVLPNDVQDALGYMRCLLESGMYDTYSAYGRYSIDILRHNMGHVPLMRYPLQFVGWGGKHNDIGPVYEIDGKCHIEPDSKIFYTDDDIQDRVHDAEELASYIAQASSGISDVCVEKLENLRTMNGDIKNAHWCITFRLKDATRKEIIVNGKNIKPDDGEALFILPKAGEFDCKLGEIVNGDPENAFILAKHNYCMK